MFMSMPTDSSTDTDKDTVTDIDMDKYTDNNTDLRLAGVVVTVAGSWELR